MSSSSPPTFVYKIVPDEPSSPIPDPFPLSQLDANDGFVHLSTSTQVPLTADLFFTNASRLWILKFEYKAFAPSIKWEGEGFPHLYGNFGGKDVHSVESFQRLDDQKWASVMGSSSWLE